MDEEPIKIGPFTVTPVPVAHPVPAYAFRVEADGRTLAYSGDTGMCPAIGEAAAGADLFLAEASFRASDNNPPDLHLSGQDCGEIATAADVTHLVLTHVPAWFDTVSAVAEARSVYAGPIEAARVGAVFEV